MPAAACTIGSMISAAIVPRCSVKIRSTVASDSPSDGGALPVAGHGPPGDGMRIAWNVSG